MSTKRNMFYVCEKDTGTYGAYSYQQTAREAVAEVARMYGVSSVAIKWEVKKVPFDSTQEVYLGQTGKIVDIP